jgi:hypothetical protein
VFGPGIVEAFGGPTHSYATGALEADMSPRVVSDRAGYANFGVALQTYAHALVDDDREASFPIGE